MVSPIWYYRIGTTSIPTAASRPSLGEKLKEDRALSGQTRTEDITCELRDQVLRGQYRPGERLPSERDLAARFHTTRDVARIALKKLEQLGIAAVEPGGARVQPVSEASLDVIGHLLDLESPPDPELVDQVLEVVGALVAANARMSVERGSRDDLARVRERIERLRKPDLDGLDRHHLVQEIAHAFMDANDNVVMEIVRRSLRSELFGRMREVGVELEALHANSGFRSQLERSFSLGPHVEDMARAVEQGDGLATYEAVHQIWNQFRRTVREALRLARKTRVVPEDAP